MAANAVALGAQGVDLVEDVLVGDGAGVLAEFRLDVLVRGVGEVADK